MRKWLPAALIAGACVFSAIVYPRLPARVPVHWNAQGEIDGWASRLVAGLALPTMMAVVWALMRWIPSLDPNRTNDPRFRGAYNVAVTTTLALLAALHVAVLGTALGWPVRVDTAVALGTGALMVITGIVLPRTPPNALFGVRTPWTMSSERVWERTHRVAGYTLLLTGLVIGASAVVEPQWTIVVLLVSGTAAAIGLIAYSYFAWRQETGRRD